MDPYRCGFGPCGVGHGGNRGWSWLGLIDSIALWLLLIAAVFVVVALIRRAGGGRATFARRVPVGNVPMGAGPTGWAPGVPPHIAQAEATLADRFARGEISADQYQDQLAVLRGYRPQQAATSAGMWAGMSAAATSAPPAESPSAAPYSGATSSEARRSAEPYSGAPEGAASESTEQPPPGPAANP